LPGQIALAVDGLYLYWVVLSKACSHVWVEWLDPLVSMHTEWSKQRWPRQ
jgi:hypothetical protein